MPIRDSILRTSENFDVEKIGNYNNKNENL